MKLRSSKPEPVVESGKPVSTSYCASILAVLKPALLLERSKQGASSAYLHLHSLLQPSSRPGLEWSLRAYGAAVGSLGSLYFLTWVAVHLYCLVTGLGETGVQRYMDIMLGLCLLVSLVSLEYGSMVGERAPLALFLILSTVVYWLELLKYAVMATKDEEGVTPLYLLLGLPILLLHTSITPKPLQTSAEAQSINDTKSKKARQCALLRVQCARTTTKPTTENVEAENQLELSKPARFSISPIRALKRPLRLSNSPALPGAPLVPSQQAPTVRIKSGIAIGLDLVSHKLKEATDKLKNTTNKLPMSATKKPAKLSWIRGKFKKLSDRTKQITTEADSSHETAMKGTKNKQFCSSKFSGMIRKLPSFSEKLSRSKL